MTVNVEAFGSLASSSVIWLTDCHLPDSPSSRLLLAFWRAHGHDHFDGQSKAGRINQGLVVVRRLDVESAFQPKKWLQRIGLAILTFSHLEI